MTHVFSPTPDSTLSLDGEWDFSLGDQSGKINVPGTWEAQGYARRIDGPAVYKRQIEVPAAWAGRQIELQFDAVSYAVDVDVNDHPVGTHEGMWTPFTLDVTPVIRPGEMNEIVLVVYKPGERYPIREILAGFLPDVCIPFGGLWQSVRLAAFEGAVISDLSVMADFKTCNVTVIVNIHNAVGLIPVINITAPDGVSVGTRRASSAGQKITTTLHIDAAHHWHPDHPGLYTVEVRLENAAGEIVAQASRKFGFRELTRDGDQLLLNRDPIFLRGILNWGWYPEILCPAPDEQTIRDEFRRVRALGYNMVKLCLYVPSPLYFDIADEEGMLLWLELPMWLPNVTERLRAQAPVEYAEILAQVRHHPSIVIYSLGCELGSAVDDKLLGQLNDILRSNTSGVLACDNSGSGEAYGGLSFDYADFNDYHFYADLHNFNPLLDHFRRDWRPARPWIFGEFCDADDFRDINEIAAANGGELPWWLVEQNPIHKLEAIAYSQQPIRMPPLLEQLPFTAQDIQRISRQQSFVMRKTILEKVRAKAGMGGYVVTGIRDTPLATSSMFDDLGRTKYDADDFREFNADSVLVLEQGRARVWKHGGDRPASVDKFNHLANTPVDVRIIPVNVFSGAKVRWRLMDLQRQVFASGHGRVKAVPPGSAPLEIAITFTTPNVTSAAQFTLEVELSPLTVRSKQKVHVRNHWPMWVYPHTDTWISSVAQIYDPASTTASGVVNDKIWLTSMFTADVGKFVQDGGRAIVLQSDEGGLPVKPCPFWRESIKLIYDHPIMNTFPHQGYADLQFYHLATDHAIDTARLAELGAVKPIIRRLDARQFTILDYLVEVEIGAGRMLVSTLRFEGGAGDQVQGLQANIAGQYLLSCMVEYLKQT